MAKLNNKKKNFFLLLSIQWYNVQLLLLTILLPYNLFFLQNRKWAWVKCNAVISWRIILFSGAKRKSSTSSIGGVRQNAFSQVFSKVLQAPKDFLKRNICIFINAKHKKSSSIGDILQWKYIQSGFQFIHTLTCKSSRGCI